MRNRLVRAAWKAAALPALAALLATSLVGSAHAGTTKQTWNGDLAVTGTKSVSYKVSAVAGAKLNVQFGWKNTAADVELRLYAPNGALLDDRTGTANPKSITIASTPQSGTYVAKLSILAKYTYYTGSSTVVANDAPVAVADAVGTTAPTPVTISPLANDSDANHDALTIQSVTAPANGTAAISGSQVVYTPAAGFSGSDSFGYTICDNGSPVMCGSSTVSVTVYPAPVISTDGLRWAPPALVAPATIQIPSSGDVKLSLDVTKDYIIQWPTAVRHHGMVQIIGGRNIEIIGGANTVDPHTGIGTRNIQLSDKPGVVDGRIIHIEGMDIDGSGGGEADGIGIGTPSAIVQLENDRITGLIGHLSSTHADVVQTWGGVKELRMYNVTGASHYNDLYLRRENSPLGPAISNVILDHVNMFGYINPAGWDIPSTIRALSIGTQPADTDCTADGGQCGPSNDESTTNCQMSGPVSLSDFYGAPPRTILARFMWPSDYMGSTGCASQLSLDGLSAIWPTLAAQGWVTGNMRLGPPPAGDFVPAGSVGLGYVSPGYQPAS